MFPNWTAEFFFYQGIRKLVQRYEKRKHSFLAITWKDNFLKFQIVFTNRSTFWLMTERDLLRRVVYTIQIARVPNENKNRRYGTDTLWPESKNRPNVRWLGSDVVRVSGRSERGRSENPTKKDTRRAFRKCRHHRRTSPSLAARYGLVRLWNVGADSGTNFARSSRICYVRPTGVPLPSTHSSSSAHAIGRRQR